MAGNEEYGKAYPRFGSWVRYLQDGGGWFQQSLPQALADQVNRHVAVLEAFGLMDIPVYVVFKREVFGWGPNTRLLYTYTVTPCGGSLHPLVRSMAIEYSSGTAAAVWAPETAPAGAAVFSYRC
jgi:hypothetical protein